MADFDVELPQTTPVRITVAPWVDPDAGEDPPRLNERGHVIHRYMRARIEPADAPTLEVNARVDGALAPPEAALVGRPISWSWGSIPSGAPMPSITSPVGGKSSRATFTISGAYPGHYVIVGRRAGGGHVTLPFDVEPTP